MIIWGTRGVTTTSEKGEFYCPQCSGRQPYKLKKVRKFFTLYFIPTIPLGTRGEYVECQRCEGTYRTEVLALDPEVRDKRIEAEFKTGLRRALAMMILADEQILSIEIEVAQKIYEGLTGSILPKADMDREIGAARSSPMDLWSYLESMRDALNTQGKEIILKAIFAVAMIDGDFDEAERELFVSVGEALELTPAHIKGIIVELANG